MSNKAIIAEHVSKRYRIGLKEQMHDSFVGAMTSWIKYPLSNYRRLRKLSKFEENGQSDDIIWALRDVSFEVSEGEVLGIIGKNGAGKSTVLKILSRITDPTSGKVTLRGKVSSLLEVGTGFHAELTGRENVYLNGTIIGMSKKEIDKKFDEIVDFAGVEKFIDTPIKRYSSGMKVRLAFAVAAFIEPEILIIDEVLAVGDVDFQRKCLGKMKDVSGSGRTVLFVSHNMGAVADLCDRTILLENGRISNEGTTEEIIYDYLTRHDGSGKLIPNEWSGERTGDGPRKFFKIATLDRNYNVSSTFINGEPIHFQLVVKGNKGDKCIVAVKIKNELGQIILHFTSQDDKAELMLTEDITEFLITVEKNILNSGTYYISAFVADHNDYPNDYLVDCLSFTVETANQGVLRNKSNIRFPVKWRAQSYRNLDRERIV